MSYELTISVKMQDHIVYKDKVPVQYAHLCLIKYVFCEKRLLQWLHLYGFYPPCLQICI